MTGDVVPNYGLELAIGIFCLVCIGIAAWAIWIVLEKWEK